MESRGENQGCTFTVTFPVRPTDKIERPRSMQRPTRTPSQFSFLFPAFAWRRVANDSHDPLPLPGISSTGSSRIHLKDHSNREVVRSSILAKESCKLEKHFGIQGDFKSSEEHEKQLRSPTSSATIPFINQRNSLNPQSLDEKIYPQFAAVQLAEPKKYCNGDNSFINPEKQEGEKRDVVLSRVLVVDDAVSNRKMLCSVIRSRCDVIEEADNGLTAVEMVKESMTCLGSVKTNGCRSQHFDLILMDFVMPKMDGPAAIKAIRDLGYAGLIFGLTGNVLDSDKDLMLMNGANFVLTKPFELEVFDKVLWKYKQDQNQEIVWPEKKSSGSDHVGILSLSLRSNLKRSYSVV